MKYLKKASDWVDKVSLFICVVMYMIFIVVMLIQVFQRNVIPKYAWTSADAVCRYAFIWGSYAGVSCASKRRRHVSVTFLPDFLKGIPRKVWAVISSLMFIALLLFLVFVGVDVVLKNTDQKLESVFFSISVTYAAIPFGCLTTAFQEFCHLIEGFKPERKEVKAS